VRTSRKDFLRQLTRIERRQTRIRRIRDRLPADTVGCSPEARYHIGKAENKSENIGRFLQKHTGDPAVMVRLAFLTLILDVLIVRSLLTEFRAQAQEPPPSTHSEGVGARGYHVTQ
jgi:hypothetical protein